MTGPLLPSWRRSRRLLQRNLLVYRHVWTVIVSGFFEPVFYLLALGFGLGAMVPEIEGLSYAAFVAPGLLAASCMNGAITDGFFNFHFKLHHQKTYDGILATPLGVADIACGEGLWALLRGTLYAAAFLTLVAVMGAGLGRPILLSPWAALALPAAVLVAAAFSAMALCLATFATRVEQFDTVMGLVVLPMFLFSGTFFPVSQLPELLQWVVVGVPLYHAVDLLRQLTTGAVGPGTIGHAGFLVLFGAGALALTIHRLERTLVR